MHNRLNAVQLVPEIYQAAGKLQQAIEAVGPDKKLMELIKIRASQINGCAYCINIHVPAARKLGVSQSKLDLLPGWRESTVFDEKERAILAWTEALTQVSKHGAPQELFDGLKQHFSDVEIVAINNAVAMINYWNRFAIGFGSVHPAEQNRE